MSDDDGEFGGDIVSGASKQDIPIRIGLYMHMANVIWCLNTLLLGSIPYYHYYGPQASNIGLVVSSISWVVLYVLMTIAVQNNRIRTAIACGVAWTVASAAFAGFVSASLYNIIALQFISIAFGQSIAVVGYLEWARKSGDATNAIRWQWAVPGMVVASVLVWLASIYGFIVEHDWNFAAGLIVCALTLVAWNAWRLTKASDYNMDEDGVTRAILEYYCGWLVVVIKRL
jgi:hypothetical protein